MFDLRSRLFAEKDEKYREFSMKLIPGCENMIGVRTPVLRAIAKEICRGDWRSVLKEIGTEYQEEKVVRGLVISSAKMDLDERMDLIREFVPLIDNWAVCDLFDFRPRKGESEEYFRFAKGYIGREEEYASRFGIVTMMKFIDEEHIDEIIGLMDSVRHDGYYVKMAVAWTLSMCYVKFPERTEAYLGDCGLDRFTYNKTLQKIVESLRVDDATKSRIKGMRRK